MLRVGDKIRLKDEFGAHEDPDEIYFAPKMRRFLGQVVTISAVDILSNGLVLYRIKEDLDAFAFTRSMFEDNSYHFAELFGPLDSMNRDHLTNESSHSSVDLAKENRRLKEQVAKLKKEVETLRKQNEVRQPSGTNRKVVNLSNQL